MKRMIPNYLNDIVLLVDVVKLIDKANLCFETRLEVLNFIVRRTIGRNYNITKTQ